MKKNITFCLLAFFVHFFMFRGMFTAFDSDTSSNTSGNSMATVLELIVTIASCLLVFFVIIIEKYQHVNFKNLIIFLLSLHCFFHFYWVAFFEYNLFNDSESFDTSSKVIILLYFVFELFLTYYVVNKLYNSEEQFNK